MYDNWLDSIEEKMGERVRFAVEMTVKYGLLALAVGGIFIFTGLALICLVCIFAVSVAYLLHTIVFLALAVLSLFVMFWTCGEDW